MTNTEYAKAYEAARKSLGIISIQTAADMKRVYIEAGKMAAKTLDSLRYSGKSELTISQWTNITKQLSAGADLISASVEEKIPQAITKAYKRYYTIDAKYITDAINDAGQNAADLINPSGISAFGANINDILMGDLLTRESQAGYKFVESVWNLFDKDGLPIGINGDYQYRIKNLIQTGMAQGRDGVKIGQDIMEYVKNGKDAVFKAGRYGQLIPGTGRYKARIAQEVDWRALRLVRSEMYMSIQNASVEQGKMNPGCTGFYDWILNSSVQHTCICPELAKAGPYKLDKVPSYPHPSCFCTISPKLMNHDEFISDLKKWSDGGESPYLDEWYKKYQKVNAA